MIFQFFMPLNEHFSLFKMLEAIYRKDKLKIFKLAESRHLTLKLKLALMILS